MNTTQSPPVSYNPTTCPDAPLSPTTTSRGRRPSISNPMHWLSRNSTQSSVGSTKPTRISEPKLIRSDRSLEILGTSPQRAGVLGSGATVVSTPDEALKDTRVRLNHDGFGEEHRQQREQAEEGQEIEYHSPSSGSSSEDEDEIPSPPDSPPLPPLPSDPEEKSTYFDVATQPFSMPPPRPCRAVPITPTLVLRPSLKSTRAESVVASPVVPALPANISTTPVPPPFNPILVSEAPSSTVDRSRIIVSLETCTATYKTTLDTLSSRPSFISNYIASLFGRRRSDSIASSVYSTASASDDMSAYRRHLTSQGLLPQSSSSVHIFLDRPSEPYVHILSYLRSPCASPEGPEVLPPRAAQAGLDSLLELRDEAAYLGLEGLHKLCVEQIRQQHRPRPRSTRGHSSAGSIHSLHASVSSLHTMLERVERQHSRSVSKDSVDELGHRSLPTPESWAGRRVRSQTRHGSVRTPPAGWI
ncbi:hypothetical protein DFH07DRAFT_743975 [Mycena maculata]|uniref:BTB domain-containing protein n=1 Tax=Mycena maculata TaxID=230809 RepID=A0AAD7J3F0_9AGAR|nr:hypothetical protein DFH07DRAFT_743975 [Mycena maculata]